MQTLQTKKKNLGREANKYDHCMYILQNGDTSIYWTIVYIIVYVPDMAVKNCRVLSPVLLGIVITQMRETYPLTSLMR